MKPEIEYRPKRKLQTAAPKRAKAKVAVRAATPKPHPARAAPPIPSANDVTALLAAFQAKEEKRRKQVREAVQRHRDKQKAKKC